MSQKSFVIDPKAFARDGERLCADVPLTAFERLADVVVARDGSVHVEVVGEKDKDGKSFLKLALSGVLQLSCQRCLSSLNWPFAVTSRLLLVNPGQPLPDEGLEDDDWDPIVAEARQDLLPLWEDEILLALPIAPRHEVCETPAGWAGNEKKSPFAALAALRGSKTE